MSNEDFENIETGLPVSINLLFNNVYLDIITVLCVASILRNKKAEVKTRELLFYYTIISAQESDLEEHKVQKIDSVNFYSSTYFRILRDINEIFLYLYNLGLVNYNSNGKVNILDSTCIITDIGIKLIENLESKFIRELLSKVQKVKKDVKFSVLNEQMLLGGRQ